VQEAKKLATLHSNGASEFIPLAIIFSPQITELSIFADLHVGATVNDEGTLTATSNRWWFCNGCDTCSGDQ
jgi:hypothetical protein